MPEKLQRVTFRTMGVVEQLFRTKNIGRARWSSLAYLGKIVLVGKFCCYVYPISMPARENVTCNKAELLQSNNSTRCLHCPLNFFCVMF